MLTTGDAADAVDKVQSNEADLGIAGRPETLPASVAFTKIGEIPLVLIAPALPCAVRSQAFADRPDWAEIPFILPEHGPSRKRIELWFRRHRISNPLIYATVGGHEAIVSMVALGCGIALIPSVVVDNSPEPVRNRISQLDNISMVEPFELGSASRKAPQRSADRRLLALAASPLTRDLQIRRIDLLHRLYLHQPVVERLKLQNAPASSGTRSALNSFSTSLSVTITANDLRLYQVAISAACSFTSGRL